MYTCFFSFFTVIETSNLLHLFLFTHASLERSIGLDVNAGIIITSGSELRIETLNSFKHCHASALTMGCKDKHSYLMLDETQTGDSMSACINCQTPFGNTNSASITIVG